MAESQTWNGSEGMGTSSGPMDGLRDKAASMANEQKDRAADGLGGIADVARHTSDDLRGQSELLASWVNIASDQLQNLADQLRGKRPADLVEDVTSFARQRPALFIGGAFLLGLGLARLPKNAPSRAISAITSGSPSMTGDREYDTAGNGGAGNGAAPWSPTGA